MKINLFLNLADQNIENIDRLACSHRRAWEYYAESITSPKGAFYSGVCVVGSGAVRYFNSSNCPAGTYSVNMGYYARDDFKNLGFAIDFYCATSDGSNGKYSLT